MTEQRRYDVGWTDEDNPRIVIAQPGDRHAMTLGEAQQIIDEAAADSFINHMASQDPQKLEANRAEAWRAELAMDDGLDRLFRRLGPPPADEK